MDKNLGWLMVDNARLLRRAFDERVRTTRFSQGVGGGVFLGAAFVNLQLDLAHDLRGGARLHFATSVSF